MPYAKLLRRLISDTNYTNAEILRKCEEENVHIDKTYFSKIINGRVEPPDETKSRAIAKVIGVDERKLIIEGYIDKAPNEIKEAFEDMSLMQNLSAIKYMELIDKSKLHELEKYLRNEPLFNMVIDILDNTNNYIKYLEEEVHVEKVGDKEEITIALANPIGIEIWDDAMSPKIEKGDRVTIEVIGENDYKSTDILLIKTKKNPEVRIRNVININSTRQIQGYNPECGIEICNKEDLMVIGRVNNVIKKIE